MCRCDTLLRPGQRHGPLPIGFRKLRKIGERHEGLGISGIGEFVLQRVHADVVMGEGDVRHFGLGVGHVTADASVTLIHRADFGVVCRARTMTFTARPDVSGIILTCIVMGVMASRAGEAFLTLFKAFRVSERNHLA